MKKEPPYDYSPEELRKRVLCRECDNPNEEGKELCEECRLEEERGKPMTTDAITEDTSRASSCTSQSRCSVLDTLSPSDRYCIDAAANAWINGGGDADGVAWLWKTLQERVRELSQIERQS